MKLAQRVLISQKKTHFQHQGFSDVITDESWEMWKQHKINPSHEHL
jgi:hypothetical protein